MKKGPTPAVRANWLLTLLIAVAGVILAGVVYLGARDVPGTGTSRGIVAEIGWDPRLIFTWLILTLFGLAAYTALTTERGRMERGGRARRRPNPMAIFLALAVVAIVLLLAPRSDGGGEQGFVPALPGEGSLAEAPPAQDTGSAWALLLVIAAGFGALGAFVALSRPSDGDTDELLEIEDVVAAVEAAIYEIEMGGDPNETVIAAYRNMEAALGRAGLGRRTAEAPREYLRRVLNRYPIDHRSIDRLTDLFEHARFSERRLNRSSADEAIRALQEVREQLEQV